MFDLNKKSLISIKKVVFVNYIKNYYFYQPCCKISTTHAALTGTLT